MTGLSLCCHLLHALMTVQSFETALRLFVSRPLSDFIAFTLVRRRMPFFGYHAEYMHTHFKDINL